MDFDLSSDQQALRDAARDLLDARCTSERVRAVTESGGFDADLWQAMIEQGWLGVATAEDEGGLGLGMVEVAVLLEQVGAHVAPVPVAQQLLAVTALAGSDLLEPLLAGRAHRNRRSHGCCSARVTAA